METTTQKTLIEKVIQFKDLFSKYQSVGLDTSEELIYNNLYLELKYQKYKDIEDYKIEMNIDTSTEIEPLISPVIEEEPIDDMITDIYEEMVQTIKQIHQKYINEGELEVDDVLLFDSLYLQLKKQGYYVEKYRIR
jgi:hypothetical protein